MGVNARTAKARVNGALPVVPVEMRRTRDKRVHYVVVERVGSGSGRG